MNPQKRYALIITGDDTSSDSALNTLRLVKQGLSKNGYTDLYCLGNAQKSQSSSVKNLDSMIHDISRTITDKDAFFVYVLAHGAKEFFPWILGDTIITLDDGRISGEDISDCIHSVRSGYTIGYINTCFAAKVAQQLGKGNTIGISPTKLGNAVSGGSLSPDDADKYGKQVSYFTLYFFSSMANQLPDGTKIKAHQNLESLFDYSAIQSDQRDKFLGSLTNITPTMFCGDLDPKNIIL